MNSNPNNPGLPLLDRSAAASDSPLAPRTPNSYMSSKILITALIALAIVIVFITAYRIYVHVFWRHRPRPPLSASWRRSQSEPPATSGGLDKAIIDTLPVFTYTNGVRHEEMGGEAECSVCLIEFQDNDSCRLLPKCNHSFHTDCIDKWFLSNSTCPMCRTRTEMVETDFVNQVGSAGAYPLPHADIDEHMQRTDLSPYGRESSVNTRRHRPRSTACISLHQEATDDIQRTRSVSLFGEENDEGLGVHMRQMLARTFSSRANGRYNMVGDETHVDVNTMEGNMENSGSKAEHDVERDPSLTRNIHLQHLHLPNWQRSSSDRCLNSRQGLQYPTNVLFWGNDSQPMSRLHTYHWQTGGRSLPHNRSMEVPKLQDGAFASHSASSSPIQNIASHLAHHLPSRMN